MLLRQGFTLFELIVVLIIIAICLAFVFPNFTKPTEQASAQTAQNNLLAIYSAQRNYYNNNGNFCLEDTVLPPLSACVNGAENKCGDSLAQINCNLSLNIQDDDSYLYSCDYNVTIANKNSCTATRKGTANTIIMTLDSPINLSGNGTANPLCNLPTGWCP